MHTIASKVVPAIAATARQVSRHGFRPTVLNSRYFSSVRTTDLFQETLATGRQELDKVAEILQSHWGRVYGEDNPLVVFGDRGIIGREVKALLGEHCTGFDIAAEEPQHFIDVCDAERVGDVLGQLAEDRNGQGPLCIANLAAELSASQAPRSTAAKVTFGAPMMHVTQFMEHMEKYPDQPILYMVPSSIGRERPHCDYGMWKRLWEHMVDEMKTRNDSDSLPELASTALPGAISGGFPQGGSTDDIDNFLRAIANGDPVYHAKADPSLPIQMESGRKIGSHTIERFLRGPGRFAGNEGVLSSGRTFHVSLNDAAAVARHFVYVVPEIIGPDEETPQSQNLTIWDKALGGPVTDSATLRLLTFEETIADALDRYMTVTPQ